MTNPVDATAVSPAAMVPWSSPRAVVLVEGQSDRAALLTLAAQDSVATSPPRASRSSP